MKKRKVEIFSAGCKVCEDVVQLVEGLSCDSCDIEVLNMQDNNVAGRAKQLSVRSVPAIFINGKLMDCCAGFGPRENDLVAAGLGQPL